MPRDSAAYTIPIVAVTLGGVGWLLLVVIDPVMQAVFGSSLWTSTTSYGTNSLGWAKSIWMIWGAIVLVGIFVYVTVKTRRAG